MSVAARFKVTQITKRPGSVARGQEFDGPAGEVKLQAAIDGGNEQWSRYTPSGEITMNVNGPAFPWFEERLGHVLAITFDDEPAKTAAVAEV